MAVSVISVSEERQTGGVPKIDSVNSVGEVRTTRQLENLMAELKTKLNDASVEDFLNAIKDEQVRQDCWVIVEMMLMNGWSCYQSLWIG